MPSKRIRLLLCSSSMDAGGSERQLLQLIQRLDRQRFDPLLYLIYETGILLDELDADVPRIGFWSEVTYPKWNWPGRIHGMQVKHLASTIRKRSIDVTYDRLLHTTLITGPATAITRTPRISTIVSPPAFDLVRSERKWLTFKKRSLQRAYLTADALLTVGKGTAENASAFYGIPRDRFQVVTNPIDVERIQAKSNQPWTGIPVRPDRQHVVAIGRLSDEKGHRFLIDALDQYLRVASSRSLPVVDLHLVGDGVLRNELRSQVARLGLDDHVHFHGHLSNPFPLLRLGQLMCLPSLYEGMPNALLEAMAAGIPVVSTNTDGATDVLAGDQLGELVPKGSAESLANAILDRFQNPERWLRRIEAARGYIHQNHDLQRWVDRMSELIETVHQQHLTTV